MTKKYNPTKVLKNQQLPEFWFNSPKLVRKSQYNTSQLNFAQQMLI